MYLVVGLGNPGPKYERTRHNVGFMAVERLAVVTGAPPFKDKWKGRTTKGSLAGEDVLLLQPLTYMNLSGESAQPAMAFHRIPIERIVVVHDELDLPFGEVRIKVGGGTAGHNGLKSMVQHCGPDFVRVRMGIGRPQKGSTESYVLGEPSPDERPFVPDLVERAAKAVAAIVEKGPQAAMNALNGSATKPSKSAKQGPAT